MRCDVMWVCLLLLSAITAGIYWSLPHNVLRVITVNLQRELVLWWSYAANKCVLEWVYGYIVLFVIPLFECGRSVIILNNSNQYIYNKLSWPIRFSSRDWISCLYKQLIQSLEENRIGQLSLLYMYWFELFKIITDRPHSNNGITNNTIYPYTHSKTHLFAA